MKHLGRIGTAALVALASLGSGAAQEKEPPSFEPATFVWKSAGGGYVGIGILDLTPELRQHFGAPRDAGVLVSRVEEDGPAEAAGILVGDVVTAVDGGMVSDSRSLSRAIREKKEGDSVVVDLRREGAPMSVTVSIEERERSVVDLADFRLRVAPFPPLSGSGVVIGAPGRFLDEEAVLAFEESMKELEERFESEEWQEKLKRLRELDLTKVQERMREVEERLKKLEKELEKESKKELER